MNLSCETLAPLVGKTVTVTQNDVPGSWMGVLDNVWGDGVLRIIYTSGFKEAFPLDRVASVTQEILDITTGERKKLTLTPPPLGLEGAEGNRSPVGDRDDPTPSRYQWSYKGVEFDYYRLCSILRLSHDAQKHALKKVIRAGQSIKPIEQDIDEAIDALLRWKEMILEDRV